VAFGDVNLSKDGVRDINGSPQSPGAGGWPTVRYFNKDTGYGGASYEKKTQKKMCEELGDEEYMQLYVEEMGNTALCQVEKPTASCSEKEVEFIEKMNGLDAAGIAAQIKRLEGMQEKKMKPALKKWLNKRLSLLKQYPQEGGKDEL